MNTETRYFDFDKYSLSDVVKKKRNLKTAVICITENGNRIGNKILKEIHQTDIYFRKRNIKELTGELFEKYDCIVFFASCGIAVRCIAPYIKSKLTDPAVIVVDESGKNVISLLSGHVGGANEMTEKIAEITGGIPVITTATDSSGKAALDMIAKENGGYIKNFRDSVKKINASIVNGEKVGLYIDEDVLNCFEEINLKGFEIVNSIDKLDEYNKSVLITDKYSVGDKFIDEMYEYVNLVPKVNVVGIGCRRGTEYEVMKNTFIEFCIENNIHPMSVSVIGSIDIKSDEECIYKLSEYIGAECRFFDSEILSKYDDKFEVSDFVRKVTGTGAVSAPSAYILSGGNIITDTLRKNGITITIGRSGKEV